MKKLLTLSALALFVLSCTDTQTNNENNHAISIEDGYQDFSSAMLTAKGIVQEVLIAAYKNPELNDFSDDYVTNRTDCPTETDLTPDVFPKTLRYDYGDETCLSDGNANMVGIVEITVSDKLGTPGMTIIVKPLERFAKDGHSAKLTEDDEDAIFMAQFKSDVVLTDSYDLFIKGLEVTDEQGNLAIIKDLEGASIGFDDVDKNNEDPSGSPSLYLDDLAIINFDQMVLVNHENELLNVTVKNPIQFDFLCKCPLGGDIEIQDEKENIQYINYSGNEECTGRILVDTEEIDC